MNTYKINKVQLNTFYFELRSRLFLAEQISILAIFYQIAFVNRTSFFRRLKMDFKLISTPYANCYGMVVLSHLYLIYLRLRGELLINFPVRMIAVRGLLVNKYYVV